MKLFVALVQIVVFATLARSEVCRTSAICTDKGKVTSGFRRVPQESDFYPSSDGSGFAQGGGYKYKYMSDRATWSGANQACESFGGTLPRHAFKNEKAYAALKAVMDAKGDKWGFWLPLSHKYMESDWQWNVGMASVSDLEKKNWGDNQPDNSGQCAYIARGMGYKWDDGDCYGWWQVICEMPV